LGESQLIVPNAKDDLSSAAHSVLAATGLRNYLALDDIEPHVAGVVAASLKRSNILASEIDCVLIATKRDYPGSPAMGRNVQAVLVDAGIESATIIGLDRIACANSLLAMCVANTLVSQGSSRNCMVLSYNKMRDDEPRLMKPTVGYLSEGAAACIVTAHPRRGYHIGTPYMQSDLLMNDGSAQENVLATFKAIGANVRALGGRFYSMTGTTPSDYRAAVLNNLSFSTMRLFSGQLDLPWSKVFRDLVPETAHLSGCDIIINIEYIQRNRPEILDGPTILFSNSAIDWVIAALTPTDGDFDDTTGD
jgi:3-oxoacyl-[acyl-carrier-protein] synthase-3